MRRNCLLLLFLTPSLWGLAGAQTPATSGQATPHLYEQLRSFQIGEESALVEDLILERDRGRIHFESGTVFFEKPAGGAVRGAVFVGTGSFRAEVPEGPFEKEHVKRMLDEEVIQSTFRTAVLRFTDDTAKFLSGGRSDPGAKRSQATELALKFQPRFLEETGVNVAARLAISILNQETPGFFLAEFDGGKRDRFTFLIDHQCRVPSMTFSINGGEKGLIFAHKGVLRGIEMWTAFYSLSDYQSRAVSYSDSFDLIDIENQEMEIDVRRPKDKLAFRTKMTIRAKSAGVQAIPFSLSESLPDYDSLRLKKAVRMKSAEMGDGSRLFAVQEDWEGGLTLYLPKPLQPGESATVALGLEGDFMFDSPYIPQCFYPLISSEWYPRHGYLGRSIYELTFTHQKKHRVVSGGVLLEEKDHPEDNSASVTRWKTSKPVALVTFGVGMFERHEETLKTEKLPELPLVFYSLPGRITAIKEDFMLAEMLNCVNYFSELFGAYHYPKLGAVYHPRGFGQGFASLLLLPRADSASKYTYSFIAHETAHQWWGNIVAWRSYRDQWLSEGFAEYSGVLYTGLRANPGAQRDLIEELRRSLKEPPRTNTGIGKGTLADVGPLIWGHRLSSRETLGAYSTLISNKGALVLRMLHFLFTDPVSGSGQPFFDMMSDFVKQFEGGTASSDDFRMVANEHFAKTPVAQKFGFKDLNWFFAQWVYSHALPKYKLQYSLEQEAGGSHVVKGSLEQLDVPDNWAMPLPLHIDFGKDRLATTTVLAYGPSQEFKIALPERPRKVELDPQLWVLSSSTETNKGR